MSDKPRSAKHHDPKCRSLAEHFLASEPPGALRETEARELAQVIQDAIDAWFDYRDGPEGGQDGK